MLTDKYRCIKLNASGALNADADDAIIALNSHFDPEDFYVTRSENALEVWLRQVDLNILSDAVDRVSMEYGSNGAMTKILPAVKDIRSFGINGSKRLYVGYNKERKVVNRKQKERRRGKHYYANDHDFSPQFNPLPDDLTDRIICEDSEAALKKLPDNCIDLVFTSPPYNFGLGYQDSNGSADGDSANWDSYFAKLFRVFDECIRVLKYGGRIVVNVQPLFSDYIPSHHIISHYFMEKAPYMEGRNSVGEK